MKGLFSIFFLLLACSSFSQKRGVNFSYIDRNVQSIYSLSPDTLSYKLTSAYDTDLEKLRSIFRWVTDNIAYKTKNYPFYKRNKRPIIQEIEDSVYESKPLNERIAIDVLKQKEAVCDGYARLFKVLCEYAGLRSEIITGYARTNLHQMGSQFKPNHRWNAVLIDSTWHLVDVTWASGFISYTGNQFVKAYDDYYFLTPPEDFIRDHYPEDYRWTLMSSPPILREFQRTPFKHSAFSKYSVSSFAPAKGVIEASVGDTISIELTMADIENKRKIAPDTLRDAVNWLPEINVADLSEFRVSNDKKKIIYQYPVINENKEWLNIIYNEDVLLRYRLNVRKDKKALTNQDELRVSQTIQSNRNIRN